MSKIGRNDPCPCGSGKKYKQCCINKELLELDDNDLVRVSNYVQKPNKSRIRYI